MGDTERSFKKEPFVCVHACRQTYVHTSECRGAYMEVRGQPPRLHLVSDRFSFAAAQSRLAVRRTSMDSPLSASVLGLQRCPAGSGFTPFLGI